jgi:hypothetical protein
MSIQLPMYTHICTILVFVSSYCLLRCRSSTVHVVTIYKITLITLYNELLACAVICHFHTSVFSSLQCGTVQCYLYNHVQLIYHVMLPYTKVIAITTSSLQSLTVRSLTDALQCSAVKLL